jgi:glutamyl endopeptidase
MNKINLLFLSMLIAAPMAQAADTSMQPFKKLPNKAVFIHGDNLITGARLQMGRTMPDALQTVEEKAAGLSTIMLTRNGDQYVSRMDPRDVAIFEKAVQQMQQLGLMNDTAAKMPSFFPSTATNGRFTTRSVIGTDNRVQITNTVVSPYWNIGRTSLGCTGTLIGPKHVLTAGHCVSNGAGTWYSALNFTVAQNGSYQPWGTKTWSNVYTPVAYHNGADTNYDYALIILSAPAHGGNAGWGQYSSGTHSITGYPAEKPLGTMWTHSGAVSTSGSFRLCYNIDTTGGNSGSGIADTSAVVRGIHTTGVGGSATQNCGTRITAGVQATLQGWINNHP